MILSSPGVFQFFCDGYDLSVVLGFDRLIVVLRLLQLSAKVRSGLCLFLKTGVQVIEIHLQVGQLNSQLVPQLEHYDKKNYCLPV